MSVTIGDMIYWIRGNSSKLPSDLKTSETQVQSFGQRISTSLKESMNFAAGQMMSQGLQQISTGLKNWADDVVKTSQEYTQSVSDLSLATGSTLEESSRLYNVADDLKVEYGDLQTSMKLYAKTLKDSGSTEKLSTETLAKLSEEYLKLPQGVARTNFALDKFGKSGDKMMKILEQGPDKIREMAAAVGGAAIVTEESKAANEAYYASLDAWQDGLRDVKLAFARDLLPYLTKFLTYLVDKVIPGLLKAVEWFGALPEPVKTVALSIGGLLVVLTSLLPLLLSIGGAINMIGGAGGITAIGTAISGVVGPALTGLGSIVGAISLPIVALVAAIGVLLLTLKYAGPQAWQTILTLGDIIRLTASRLATNAKNWFANVGVSIVKGIGEGIKSGWKWLTDLVAQVASSLLNSAKKTLGIKSPSRAFADQVGKQSALGIGTGFQENIQSVISGMKKNLTAMPAAMTGGLGGVSGGASSISVGTVKFDSSLSAAEKAYLNKNSKTIAKNTVLEAIS